MYRIKFIGFSRDYFYTNDEVASNKEYFGDNAIGIVVYIDTAEFMNGWISYKVIYS